MIMCTQTKHISQCTTFWVGAGIKITMQLTMVLNLLQYYQYKKYYANVTEEKSHILMETEFQFEFCTCSVQLSYTQVYCQLTARLPFMLWNCEIVKKWNTSLFYNFNTYFNNTIQLWNDTNIYKYCYNLCLTTYIAYCTCL